jgi:hypothetical protein
MCPLSRLETSKAGGCPQRPRQPSYLLTLRDRGVSPEANPLSASQICLANKLFGLKTRQTLRRRGYLGVVAERWPKATRRSSVWNSSELVVNVMIGSVGVVESNFGIPGGASPFGATGTGSMTHA